MATKSIYKDVCLKSKDLSRKLILALENAEKFRGKEVVMTKKVHDIKEDQIKRFFGDK